MDPGNYSELLKLLPFTAPLTGNRSLYEQAVACRTSLDNFPFVFSFSWIPSLSQTLLSLTSCITLAAWLPGGYLLNKGRGSFFPRFTVSLPLLFSNSNKNILELKKKNCISQTPADNKSFFQNNSLVYT